jgi:hypothetical protein
METQRFQASALSEQSGTSLAVATKPQHEENAADQVTSSTDPVPSARCGCSDPRKWNRQTWIKFSVFLILVGIIL